jgi:hypothetical protein
MNPVAIVFHTELVGTAYCMQKVNAKYNWIVCIYPSNAMHVIQI